MNLNHIKRIIRHEVNNRVSPSTGVRLAQFTTRARLPERRRNHEGFDIDMGTLITILDHGYDDSEGFDSAEFVL